MESICVRARRCRAYRVAGTFGRGLRHGCRGNRGGRAACDASLQPDDADRSSCAGSRGRSPRASRCRRGADLRRLPRAPGDVRGGNCGERPSRVMAITDATAGAGWPPGFSRDAWRPIDSRPRRGGVSGRWNAGGEHADDGSRLPEPRDVVQAVRRRCSGDVRPRRRASSGLAGSGVSRRVSKPIWSLSTAIQRRSDVCGWRTGLAGRRRSSGLNIAHAAPSTPGARLKIPPVFSPCRPRLLDACTIDVQGKRPGAVGGAASRGTFLYRAPKVRYRPSTARSSSGRGT